MKEYIYLFVRSDLPKNVQLIQSSHAAYEHGLRVQGNLDEPAYFAGLSVDNEEALSDVERVAERNELPYYKFYEPDYDTGYTAIAVGPVPEANKSIFKKWALIQA